MNTSSIVFNGTVLATQVLIVSISPALFNWSHPEDNNEYLFRPSLLSAPDLPSWMSYLDSKAYDQGFIYGVPPVNMSKITLEIDGLSRIDYTSKRIMYEIDVIDKQVPPVENEVQIKISNVNVDDMLDRNGTRLHELEDIFRNSIWPESDNDLRTTFIKSATQMGERLPLNPETPVGVVIWLGSSVNFSSILEKLEYETRPLRKLTHCPREFKRTTLDKTFRTWNFILDWCSFRLMNKKRIAEETDKINKKKVSNPGLLSTKWNSSLHSYQVPDRNYWLDFVYVSAIPAFILIVLGAFLVYIFYEIDETSHEVRSGHENRPAMEEDLAQYASPEPLRSLSLLRDIPDTPSRASPAPSSHKFRPDPPPYSSSKE
uniref:Epsilon-sarcoglycan n=1 Tax=Cacopsylla melanoneura TaxID=428564 RepID=A0A8D8YKP9_9HEMI